MTVKYVRVKLINQINNHLIQYKNRNISDFKYEKKANYL